MILSGAQSKAQPMSREFESRPDQGIMVSRDRFKYRFKLSALRHNSQSPLENMPKKGLNQFLSQITIGHKAMQAFFHL